MRIRVVGKRGLPRLVDYADGVSMLVVRFETDGTKSFIGIGKRSIKAVTKDIMDEFVFSIMKPFEVCSVIPFSGLFEEVHATLTWIRREVTHEIVL